MRLTKKYLIIGVLALSAALAGSACGKKNDSNQTQNTNTAEVSGVPESEEESSSEKKDESKKTEMKFPVRLAKIGEIDLDANAPNLADFAGSADYMASDKTEVDGHRCFFDVSVIDEPNAELMETEFTANLEEVPEKMKMARSPWETYLTNNIIYYMSSEQDFEIISDKSEKVTYDGVDFIREEGRIEVRRKDSSNTYYPELVTLKYAAFYYTYKSNEPNPTHGDGMGMAIWGTALGEAGEERLNDYNLIKETADKSMATLQTTNRFGQYN